MEIRNLVEAVEKYVEANSEGYYSPRYATLMFDKSDCKIWADEFYSLGHNDFCVYNSKDIINISSMMCYEGIEITVENVENFIENKFYSGKKSGEKIKEIREEIKMKQVDFAEYFKIPIRTLQNWESGKTSCPVYVFDLIAYKILHEFSKK